jgi:uncharacterized membrane protein YobD (UPF0266 family)
VIPTGRVDCFSFVVGLTVLLTVFYGFVKAHNLTLLLVAAIIIQQVLLNFLNIKNAPHAKPCRRQGFAWGAIFLQVSSVRSYPTFGYDFL